MSELHQKQQPQQLSMNKKKTFFSFFSVLLKNKRKINKKKIMDYLIAAGALIAIYWAGQGSGFIPTKSANLFSADLSTVLNTDTKLQRNSASHRDALARDQWSHYYWDVSRYNTINHNEYLS